MTLSESIHAAWRRRDALHAAPDIDVYRVFHGWGEGCPGLEIDRYGAALLIEHRAAAAEHVAEAVAALDTCHRFERVVVRPHGDDARALRGPLEGGEIVVEHGLRFHAHPARPGNAGLYLDARPARRWIREHADGRRVLNLFAFTGSLGVAAAAGGARGVIHVDSARSALEACRTNHELNGLPIDDRALARVNVYQHLRRNAARRQRFDGIIVDPPPLTGAALHAERTPGGRGVLGLAPLVARMLAPGGWILCFFHHDDRDAAALERAFHDAAGVALEVIWRGESGPDFPELVPERKLRLAAFARAG